MYIASVLLLTLILPLGSVAVDREVLGNALPVMLLVGKWFAFWAGGVRLFVAGLRQSVEPRFTAEAIFGIAGEAPLPIVRELGMAVVAMGTIGILAVLLPDFVLPAAIASGLYSLLAGIGHVRHGGRNALRTAAMAGDLIVAAALLSYVGWAAASYL
ncbi:MAG: hypothetical protein JOZ72_06285 [Alphaproteobacteria bacterium]|nr:hypothetical protein [Alphaproteobacteria bacterium]